MGNYNPHAPYILGEEWVPIRNEDTIFSPAVNSVELGHGFITAAAYRLATARFYINQLHPFSDRGQTFMAAIYPRGSEDQTGPISKVTIPANAVIVTNGTVSGAATAIDSLLTPSTSSGISLDCSQPNAGLAISFGVSAFAGALSGKRILDVSLVFGVAASDDIVGPTRDVNTSIILLTTTATIGSSATPEAIFGRLRLNNEIDRASYGEINQFWTANSPTTIADRVPWTYTQLTRLDATATQLYTRIDTGTNRSTTANSSCYVWYAALEVTYCEEQRVAVGATQFGTSFTAASFGVDSVLGANQIVMHDMAGGLNPSLAAGDYLLMLSSANVGGLNDNQAQLTSDYPNLNALRQMYSIPSLPATRVNIPFPLADHVGDTFTSESYAILPQISLHATGGTLIEPHVYGRQVAAQVYGTNTATQGILDTVVGTATPYPQVRYYARRFGDTTVALTLTGVGALANSSVSITPTDFDALAEILDGWREVTLRFNLPPALGAVTGVPRFTWSAVGETAGNRWEILGAAAPAVSGVAGNLFNKVPPPNQLGPATYGGYGGFTPATTFINVGAAAHADNASVTPTVPAGLAAARTAGNVVTLLILAAIRSSGTGTVNTPTGYTTLFTNGNYVLMGKYWDGVEGAPLITFNNGAAGDTCSAQMAAWTNVSLDIVGTSALQLNGAAQNIAYPALNVVDNALTLFTGWKQDDCTSINLLPGLTDVATATTATGNDQTMVWQQLISGPITLASGSFTVIGGAAAISRGTLIALRQIDFAGEAVMLNWMPQGVTSPFVSVPTDDIASDAVLILSQDPPTITGFTISSLTQTVTGIGLDCGTLPCCIPSGISYQRLTWSTSTLPATGFGGYELQRLDTVGQTFETIMLATSIAVTGFNDFEARVGITSAYRIRALNALNFAGQWSALVSGAPPTPGVTGGCSSMTGALIFTSNDDQSGHSNAAYVMNWADDPIEDFKLAEGDNMVSFQPMYNRDGSIAFHGTERGLEAFDRSLLLQAAAIDPVRLADARTIRDLAWASLPYICVRDDIGDRWFANVRVPSVNARLNRTRYMARVEITETTLTPWPVNP